VTKPVIICVVGARPNFVKIAPVLAAFAAHGGVDVTLVHTGQHYDRSMNDSFFDDLGIRPADINLDVGSGSHAVQTAEIMRRFEPVVEKVKPSAVVVVGDVNSTIAAALVAAKMLVPVVHIEAGLRSYDRSMPEEVNRILTDQLSDLLFVTERSAIGNLRKEGIPEERIHFVGNVMIDALKHHRGHAIGSAATFAAAGVAAPSAYALLTLHRPSNVDNPRVLARLFSSFSDIGRKLPVVFPVHPRTRRRIEEAGLGGMLRGPEIIALEPLRYLEMIGLMAEAKLVLTDSGGVQEETTALGIPCLTLRENTERPVTVEQGTSTLVGNDPARIRDAVSALERAGGKRGRMPELWDGQAAPRIVTVMARWLEARK